jgi:hypothetical protein
MSIRLAVAAGLLLAVAGCRDEPADGRGMRVTLLGNTSAETALRERNFEVRKNVAPGPIDVVLFCVSCRQGVTFEVLEGLAAGAGSTVDHAAILITDVPAGADQREVDFWAWEFADELVPVLGAGVPQQLEVLRLDDPQLASRVRRVKSGAPLGAKLGLPDIEP